MALGSGSAGVYVREIDNSQTVEGVSTSVGAIVLASNKGEVGTRKLITSQANFLEEFGSPDPQIGFGHHCALAFLAEANRLYVTRVAPGALYGGMVVTRNISNLSEASAWSVGLADPAAYAFAVSDFFAIYAKDPGEWNNTIRCLIYPNTKLNDGSFYVDVYIGSNANAEESHLVHLNRIVDGYGVQINIQEYINRRSKYIRVVQNDAQPDFVNSPNTIFINAIMDTTIAGGTNGTAPTTGNYMSAWDLYTDPEKVDVNILINGGLTTPAIQLKMDTIAQSRMDCLAVLDVAATEQAVSDAINYRRSSLALNSNYSALYSGDLFVLDSYTGLRLYVPPSGHVAAVMALTDRDYGVMFAPAGLNRGRLRVLGVRHNYNQGDRDALADNEINYIRNIAGEGFVVWEAITLQTKQSALSYINVRRMMMYLEKSLSNTALYSVFDPNDDILRSKLVEMAEGFLKDLKQNRGLYTYKVTCDETNNPPEVIAAGDLVMNVEVEPVLPAKRILLTATINKTGARFTAFSEQ